jgi:chromate transporter
MFRDVGASRLPVWASLDWRAAAIAAGAAVLLFRLKRSVLEVLALSAIAALGLSAL